MHDVTFYRLLDILSETPTMRYALRPEAVKSPPVAPRSETAWPLMAESALRRARDKWDLPPAPSTFPVEGE